MSKESKKTQVKIKYKRITLKRLIIFIIICAISVGLGLGFREPIENFLNNNQKASFNINAQITDNTTLNSNNLVLDENGLIIHFIDVGQGDSIAIRFPDNKTMLIDAGTPSSKTKLVNYLKNNFFEQNENVFDYLLLTHSDSDHSGGMVEICKNFVINKIYRPYIYSKYSNDTINFDETNGNSTNKYIVTTLTYYESIMAFNNEFDENGNKTEVVFTDLSTVNSIHKISGADYYFQFYAPVSNYITSSAGSIANDYSPIMVLNYNQKSIMFTGDASITSENLAMAKYNLPDVDVLKVGHHGSHTSTGTEFLAQIKPEYAIICVGEGNSYDHPRPEVLNRLSYVGAQIYRTDVNKNIILNITSDTYSLSEDTVINFACELNSAINDSPEKPASKIYIKVEYLIAGVIVISAYFCFGVKIKVEK